uniref:Uncharacterized protein n=1 Tax=Octopus bimaculoides TaxID=37653 RepID=A0A0L8GJM1_OCTBM
MQSEERERGKKINGAGSGGFEEKEEQGEEKWRIWYNYCFQTSGKHLRQSAVLLRQQTAFRLQSLSTSHWWEIKRIAVKIQSAHAPPWSK